MYDVTSNVSRLPTKDPCVNRNKTVRPSTTILFVPVTMAQAQTQRIVVPMHLWHSSYHKYSVVEIGRLRERPTPEPRKMHINSMDKCPGNFTLDPKLACCGDE